MFNKKPIYSAVMAVIKSKIESAETEYKQKCQEVDVLTEAKVKEVYTLAENDKKQALDTIVNSILSRVI